MSVPRRKSAAAKARMPQPAALAPQPSGIGALLSAWEPGVSAWLKLPYALTVIALLCAALAFRGNHWDWIYGVLHYGGQDHQNLTAYDARNHVNAINAAATAIKEGTLLVREVTWFNFVSPPVFHRYPFFQFYGTCAYTFPALLVCAGLQAYHAFLLTGFLSFFAGFIGAFRVGRLLGLRVIASLAGAALFTFAPYHLTDWYGRVAFTETVGLALMPWVFYGLLRCSKDRRAGSLLLSTGLWSWLMMTHTILHILAAIFFFGVLVLNWALEDREDLHALLRPFAAYAFACLCSAWALYPIVRFGPEFGVASAFYPQDWAWASSLGTLFSPIYYSSPKTDGFIGLQIGWPLVAAWLGGLWLSRRKPWLMAYSGLIGLCIFVAWSPFDIWKYLGLLKILQFPYRVLAIIITFGAFLGAVTWDALGDAFEGVGFVGLLLLLTLTTSAYVARGGPGSTSEELSATYNREGFLFEGPRYPYTIGNPNSAMMQANYPSTAYDLGALTWTAKTAGGEVQVNASGPLALTPTVDYGSWTTVKVPGAKKGEIIQLPAAWYPKMYRLSVNGAAQDYGRVDNRLAVQVAADGDQEIRFHFGGMPAANAVSYLAWLIFLGLAFKAWRDGNAPLQQAAVASKPAPKRPDKAAKRPKKPVRRKA